MPGIAALAARGDRVAYFCAEFGLSEMLPIYSGGLGVLAGDHLKSSSDLGMPLVGVGIFYREGFFRQTLTADARQKESYPIVDPLDLPVEVLPTPAGVAPVVTVSIGDRDVHLLIRRVRVGRTPLLLLDAHLPSNRPADREITNRLYSGDLDMRIRQEIVLGIGGMRALEVAGLRPTVRHANEGHAAFLGLERIRQLRAERGLSFAEAREIATAGNVFTTHTPVPAGIDLFPRDVMQKYFAKKLEGYGIGLDELLGLGRQVPEDPNEYFSMAVLGLRLSSRVNGVSQLHAQVSRRLWRGVFPDAPLSEIPISAVTNGVHGPTWTSKEIGALNPREGDGPDPAELWRRHEHRRAALVETVRIRTAAARTRRGAPDVEVAAAWQLLDPTALTIGFARRFATYKRATLIFQDPARLSRLLSDPNRPVQLVFAGKAHPRDHAGKDFLRRVGEFAAQPEFLGRVVLVEDYDMRLARRLVQGVDVWLNNPRRPFEASGTSGHEGRDERRPEPVRPGRLVGRGAARRRGLHDRRRDGRAPGRRDGELSSTSASSPRSSRSSTTGRTATAPACRPAGRRAWRRRRCRLGRIFHSDRMVGEYVSLAYAPAADRVAMLSADDDAKAKELAAWKEKVRSGWDEVGFVSVTTVPGRPRARRGGGDLHGRGSDPPGSPRAVRPRGRLVRGRARPRRGRGRRLLDAARVAGASRRDRDVDGHGRPSGRRTAAGTPCASGRRTRSSSTRTRRTSSSGPSSAAGPSGRRPCFRRGAAARDATPSRCTSGKDPSRRTSRRRRRRQVCRCRGKVDIGRRRATLRWPWCP